ncbi:hypothetical protein AAII07_41810 [Microvirga sp. 0TCS3.31]
MEQDAGIFSNAEVPQRSWATLIRDLLVGPGRTALAADVAELLRRHDYTGAQQRLEAAVDIGTFAIIISDGIQDPALQEVLQAFARQRQDALLSQGARVGDEGVDGGKADKLGDAAVGKSVGSEAALKEQQMMREQLAASREKEARVAELEYAVEQEKERVASLTRALDSTQELLASTIQDATRAAEIRDEDAREKERANAARLELTLRLTAAHEQIEALQKIVAKAGELQTALERERELASHSARETNALKTQLAILQKTRPSATDTEGSAAREKRQTDAAVHQLNALWDQTVTLRASEAKMQDELQQEKERSAAMARQLETVQKESATLAEQVRNAAAIEAALQLEKEKVAAASHDLSSLRKQIALLEKNTEFIPAVLIFQTPLTFSEPLADKPQTGAASGGVSKGSVASQRKTRQAVVPLEAGALNKSSGGLVKAQPLELKPSPQSRVARRVKPPSGSRDPHPTYDKAFIGLSRSPRSLARESNAVPRGFYPALPAILLPDEGHWRVY